MQRVLRLPPKRRVLRCWARRWSPPGPPARRWSAPWRPRPRSARRWSARGEVRRKAASSDGFSAAACSSAAIRRAAWDSGADDQRDGLLQDALHAAGHLGQQDLPGLEVGQPADLVGSRSPALEHPGLDDQQRVGAAEVARPFATLTGSPEMKAIAVGPTRWSSIPSTPACRAAMVVKVFFDTATSRRRRESGGAHRGPSREPAVLGQHNARRAAEALAQLRDGGCLVRPRHSVPLRCWLFFAPERQAGGGVRTNKRPSVHRCNQGRRQTRYACGTPPASPARAVRTDSSGRAGARPTSGLRRRPANALAAASTKCDPHLDSSGRKRKWDSGRFIRNTLFVTSRPGHLAMFISV